MRLARPDAADNDDLALVGEEAATGEVTDECFVDRHFSEQEALELLGVREIRRGDLVLD